MLTERFESFIREFGMQVQQVLALGEAWLFIEVALGYLVKGFFADNQDQLLWHIVALDALLGEPEGSAARKLERRLAAIYSHDAASSQRAREAFTALYKLRNHLVHGRRFDLNVSQGRLRVARALARKVTVRMVRLLAELAGEIARGVVGFTPSRDEVLRLVEMDDGVRGRLTGVLGPFGRAKAAALTD